MIMQSEQSPNVSLIAARIISGRLPRWQKYNLVAGNGDGQSCACCDRPITGTEIQYDMQVSDGRALPMHLHCYEVWRDESLTLRKTELLRSVIAQYDAPEASQNP